MSHERDFTPLTEFEFEKRPEAVAFGETVQVTEGVDCDVYSFMKDSRKDLGIIRIVVGGKTPVQKVLKGERTVEGYISGKGKLIISRANGQLETHRVGEETSQKFSIDIGIGDIMQWQADINSELVAFEICIPPYEDGRYKNLT